MSDSHLYFHEPLPRDNDAIRLLTVLPEVKNGLLQCRLEIGKTTDEFTALSYTWGPSTHDQAILLNGKHFHVRYNLWDFLHVAKDNFPENKLWIDAVCINQADINERNLQVRRMGQIYSSAVTTLTWLGRFTAPEKVTVDVPSPDVQSIKLRSFDAELEECLSVFHDRSIPPQQTNLSHKQGLPPDYNTFGPVITVLELICQHPYWRRVWIVQEIRLSANRVVVIDHLRMQWTILVDILNYVIGARGLRRLPRGLILLAKTNIFRTLVASEQSRFRQQLGLQSSHGMGHRSFTSLLSKFLLSGVLSSQSAHAELARLRDRYSDDMVRNLTCPKSPMQRNKTSAEIRFLDFIRGFEKSLCYDKRDKIYGFTAMQEQGVSFPIEYNLSIYDLYFRACRFFLFPENRGDPLWAWNWTITASVLLRQLNIGLLDLIFGDVQHRSLIYSVSDNHEVPAASDLLHLTQTYQRGNNNWLSSTITGRCSRCNHAVHFECQHIPSLKAFCVLQCHNPSVDLQALAMPSGVEHLIVYQSQGLPGYHSVRSSSFDEHHPLSAATGASSEPAHPSNSMSLAKLTDLVRLHTIYPRSRAQKAEKRRLGRRKVACEPSLLEYLEQHMLPSTNISGTLMTKRMITSLDLEKSTEDDLLSWFTMEGFVVESPSQSFV